MIEVDFRTAEPSCANVWINADASLYQLHPSDQTMDEVEAFLGDINHRAPNRPFTPVQPVEALQAISRPANHATTSVGESALLQWLLRTQVAS